MASQFVDNIERLLHHMPAIIANLTVVHMGIVLGWSMPAVIILESAEEHRPPILTKKTVTDWIVTIPLFSASVSSIFAGVLSDKIGRKTAMLITAFPSFVCWLLKIMTSNVLEVFVIRFVLGLLMGISTTAVCLYIDEISEESSRGALEALWDTFAIIGESSMYFVGLTKNYYILTIPGLICSAILQIGLLFVPESPLYLLSINDQQKAEQSLKILRGRDYDPTSEINGLFAQIQQKQLPSHVILRENRISFAICVTIMFFRQFMAINVFLIYGEMIFKKVAPDIPSSLGVILMSFVVIVVHIASGITFHSASTRMILTVSGLGMAIPLCFLATSFHVIESGDDNIYVSVIAFISVLLYLLFYSIGWGPVPYILIEEICPPETRRMGTIIAIAITNIASFLISCNFRLLAEIIDNSTTFLMFSDVCFLAVIFVLLFYPE